MTPQPTRPVRIANCSGFFGDRLAAAREQVDGGPIDVLTGDWLAELTMLILARQRMKHGAGSGYARTFLTQMQQTLGECLRRDIKVVTNAGGLDPQGLADALREMADAAGLNPTIAVVTGDDVLPRLQDLQAAGETFTNLDTGESLGDAGVHPLTANAYLGGRAISAALAAGADVVITGRVTDAALVIGPAAWWHGWSYDNDLDQLAGAVVAGHIIECGAQATGGNYPFFGDVPGLEHPGFPIAEVAGDGSSIITKHDDTGGLVSAGTVTAQLLYEIAGPAYANPDVTARFDTIVVDQVGRDRVRVSGVRGQAPPERLKVSMNYLGGFRNSITLVLTGLDVEAKADLALQAIAGLSMTDVRSGSNATELARRSTLDVAELAVTLVAPDTVNSRHTGGAQAHLHLTAKDPDPKKVGKPFTAPVVESALSTYPGMFPTAPPAGATPYGVYWPTTVPVSEVDVAVTVNGQPLDIASPEARTNSAGTAAAEGQQGATTGLLDDPVGGTGAEDSGARDAVSIPLGWLAGARSGDKGGNANIGVWIPSGTEAEAVALARGEADSLVAPVVRTVADMLEVSRQEGPLAPDQEEEDRADAAYRWLHGYLTPKRVAQLLPETDGLPIDVFPLPNLRALNIVIHGLLGRGVSDSTRLDPQAKGLAEHLRSLTVEVPRDLLAEEPS